MADDRLTFLDLFAGIGGFHLALRGLGDCVLASEIDEQCQAVYRDNFPGVAVVGDIRELTKGGRRSIPEHDILCAGFPCQPFSKSGYQLGMRDDERGTLFFEIMRVVQARHPKFIVLENVRNIAGPRHRETWLAIVAAIRSEGYSIADDPAIFSPHLLPPARGGAPQVRQRVFILAARSDIASSFPEPLIRNAPVGSWSPDNWNIDDYLDTAVDMERYGLRPEEINWLSAWQDFVERVGSERLPGFPIWVDTFAEDPSDSSMPDWKTAIVRKNQELFATHRKWLPKWIRRHSVDEFPPSRRKFEWQARGYPPDVWDLVIHLRPSGIRVRPPTYLPALVAMNQTSIIGRRRRRITPREAARLQGFPSSFRLHRDDPTAYRQLGNAVNVGVVRYVTKRLLNSATSPQQLRLVS